MCFEKGKSPCTFILFVLLSFLCKHSWCTGSLVLFLGIIFCYQAAELPIVCHKEGYKMMVDSVHLNVHVQLATDRLDNIRDKCN